MTRCARCSASIPAGRNYCHPHYLEALRDYERELQQYQHKQAAWENLSPEEQKTRNQAAENEEVATFAALVGIGLGGFTWYATYQWLSIDGLLGLLILIVVTGVSASWSPLQLVLGRTARAFFVATPALLIAGLALLLLALISSFVAAHWRSLAPVLTVALLAFSLIQEGTGAHHSTGAPRTPLEPRP